MKIVVEKPEKKEEVRIFNVNRRLTEKTEAFLFSGDVGKVKKLSQLADKIWKLGVDDSVVELFFIEQHRIEIEIRKGFSWNDFEYKIIEIIKKYTNSNQPRRMVREARIGI